MILDQQVMSEEYLLNPPLHQLKEGVEHVGDCCFVWLHARLVLVEVKVGF